MGLFLLEKLENLTNIIILKYFCIFGKGHFGHEPGLSKLYYDFCIMKKKWMDPNIQLIN